MTSKTPSVCKKCNHEKTLNHFNECRVFQTKNLLDYIFKNIPKGSIEDFFERSKGFNHLSEEGKIKTKKMCFLGLEQNYIDFLSLIMGKYEETKNELLLDYIFVTLCYIEHFYEKMSNTKRTSQIPTKQIPISSLPLETCLVCQKSQKECSAFMNACSASIKKFYIAQYKPKKENEEVILKTPLYLNHLSGRLFTHFHDLMEQSKSDEDLAVFLKVYYWFFNIFINEARAIAMIKEVDELLFEGF